VGPRSGPDAVKKEKFPGPAGNRTLKSDRPARSQLLYRVGGMYFKLE